MQIPDLSASVYQLRIVAQGISPLIWRLLVRGDMSLAGLHDVLQITFAWSDVHLHGFQIHGKNTTALSRRPQLSHTGPASRPGLCQTSSACRARARRSCSADPAVGDEASITRHPIPGGCVQWTGFWHEERSMKNAFLNRLQRAKIPGVVADRGFHDRRATVGTWVPGRLDYLRCFAQSARGHRPLHRLPAQARATHVPADRLAGHGQ